ncbi:MAG: helix-turn-helix transcriptional regulator [Desulfobacteraceae bacterium]|nr:helix-turn-helix transcriptional regulator [Desulfobacteraceae bacterium]
MCNHHTGNTGRSCSCLPFGRMLGFIQPWLLLLLLEASAHGYELVHKLNQNEDTRGVDPGFLYRTLRQFEEDGLVKSSWDVEGHGPARRVYEITPDGVEYLHAWADHIRGTRERLGRLLRTYESRFKSQTTEERR